MGEEPYVHIDTLLKSAIDEGSSDLHLAVGMPPMIRKKGVLVPLNYPRILPDNMNTLLFAILQPHQIETLDKNWELDFSHSITGISRFRGNIMKQRGTYAAVFRVVPYSVPSFEKLGLPDRIRSLGELARGLVLVTGPTGSGKSTTLAALIDLINQTRSINIVTVEDPIEFLHRHRKSIIKQREVGFDTHSFANALRHVLRHDPDVILVGEMRDVESISIALTAAETGHLVFSTLHTQTAPLTIARIVDVFDSSRREQVRQQLANSLRAVVSQQLLPSADGTGRVVAVEFMSDTPAIRNQIREGVEHQLYSSIQTSRHLGMQTMDQSLAELCLAGKITKEIAHEYCIDKVELDRLLQRSTAGFSSNPWK